MKIRRCVAEIARELSFWLLVFLVGLALLWCASELEAQEVYLSKPAENGVRHVRIEFPGLWPRVIDGRTPEDAVREEHVVDLGESFAFYAAGSFIGLDRGDVGEFVVSLGCAGGGPVFYSRSLHKEVATWYPAETQQYVALPRCRRLKVWFEARVTGPNDLLRPSEPWSARPHFGVRLWTVPDYLEPGPGPEEPEPRRQGPTASDYVTLARAGDPDVNCALVDNRRHLICDLRQRLQENAWRGWRDLEHVATKCAWAFAPGERLEAHTAAEFLELAELGKDLDADGWRFEQRLATEHPDFPGRTVVNKEFFGKFREQLQAHLSASNALTGAIADHPQLGVSFDTLRGWCRFENQRRK